MRLEHLHISYSSYRKITEGTIQFSGENQSEITLKLDDSACQKILMICAEQLVLTAKDAAENLTAAILENTQQKLLIPIDPVVNKD